MAVHVQAITKLYGDDDLEDKVLMCPQSFNMLPNKLNELVKKKAPVNPPGMLHNSKLYGVVTVEVCVDSKGKVFAVKAVDGHPMARASVIDSIKNWSFIPYRDKGKPVPVHGLIDVNYDFRSDVNK